MISGRYVSKFSEASHVCFDGNLDDPSFRSIAIQRILSVEPDSVTASTSGRMRIGMRRGRENVVTTYVCPIFGKQTAVGHPFLDSNSKPISP